MAVMGESAAMPFVVRLLAVVALAVPFTANACWKALTLDEFVKDKPLIVVGEITRIDAAPAATRAYDTAYIKIDHVLHSTPPHLPQVGGEIPLTMPSPKSEQKMSVDLYYKKGDRGVWILHFFGGRYTAGHPMSLQKPSIEADVVAAIKANAAK